MIASNLHPPKASNGLEDTSDRPGHPLAIERLYICDIVCIGLLQDIDTQPTLRQIKLRLSQ